MTRLMKIIAVGATALLTAGVFAASPSYVCGLTGKTSKQCCCEQKAGKFLCKYKGKTLDTCCCTTK
jgi:hypothetical protein